MEYASEFRYRNPVIYPDDIVIAVSQSGETADTLAAIELAKQNGAFVYGICNVIGSSIARATDSGTYIHVGPEIGVASTKAFTGQVTVLTMLALMIARVKGTIDQECSRKIAKHLLDLPAVLEEVLRLNDRIADFSKSSPTRTTSSTWDAGTTTPRRWKVRSNSRRSPTSTQRATLPPK